MSLDHATTYLKLLRQADLLLFTSRPTGEGMPGVLIEAGLSGLPVVTTPVPGVTSVIRDGVTGIITEDSVPGLVEAVKAILADPVRRRDMGAAARAWCKSEFSLDLMAQRWRAALEPLLAGQARARG